MLKQMVILRKLEQKRDDISRLEEETKELEEKKAELEDAVREAETDEEFAVVEGENDTIEAKKAELEEKKTKLLEEIEALETELAELEEQAPTDNNERGKRGDKMEFREGIAGYIRTKGQERAGFTSVEGGALIPEELLSAHEVPQDDIDLSKLVNVADVKSGAGKYPIIKKSGKKMASTAELAANPELSKPVITEINYDIETYRGYIPVSQEVIDDAEYDVAGMIADEITDQELNTKNFAIATILKTAPAKSATGLDGLKSVFNVDIKKVYTAKAILSASLYNELDTTKDLNGRYLLQDDVTVESGKKLFGKEVVVLDDDMIGTAEGDLVGFIGDPKAFATLFDRKRSSVKWVDNDVYGQLLAGYVRFDVKATDTEAGFYVTYTPEAEA